MCCEQGGATSDERGVGTQWITSTDKTAARVRGFLHSKHLLRPRDHVPLPPAHLVN